ncbi:MAG TPA: lytic transglycosylase domain-containing protein [Burkholderiales bacterium]|nr:lytic transglycosylase domain-containing protein [Burkholderiales bacterium]
MTRALRAAALCAALLAAPPARAGNQDEEKLADSVRTSMQASIADRAVPVLLFKHGAADAYRWLSEMSRRLENRIPDRKQRTELLKTVQYEATRAGLDPQLVLGVIQVESGFHKYAVSRAGARGYMQVMPFWVRLIGERQHNLFALRTNLRYGCVLLRYYLDRENGDFYRALGRYNGSLGQPDYPNLVYSAWKGVWKYDGATR